MPMRGALWYEEFDDFTVPVGSGALRGGGASSSPLGPQGADFTAVTLSGIAAVDALLAGNRWVDAEITFSFPTAASQYTDYTTGAHRLDTFTPLSQPFREAVRYILGADNPESGGAPFLFGLVASFTNLGFSEVAGGGGTMRFGFSDAHDVAWGYYPSAAPGERGDAFFNEFYMGIFPTPESGSYTWLTAIHEIGHTLGLKHAHETNGISGTAMPSAFDSLEYTVMTYRSYEGASGDYYSNETYGYPQTFMMMDIRALQQMYGADFTANDGDTIYAWSDLSGEMIIDGVGQGGPNANRVFLTVWDGGGFDTYDFSNYSGGISVNLNPGEYSRLSEEQLAYLGDDNYARGNVFNALQYNGDPRSLIEAAIGGDGDDTLIGNQADNSLQGGAGDDDLAGGAGNDTLNGGSGTDTATFRFDNIGATAGVAIYGRVMEGAGTVELDDGLGGIDTLIDIERIAVIGTSFADRLEGGSGGDQLRGQDGDDRLYGGPGEDHLYGGVGADVLIGGENKDYLSGGAGADLFVWQSATDSSYTYDIDVVEDFETGTDRLEISHEAGPVGIARSGAFTEVYFDRAPDLIFESGVRVTGVVQGSDVQGAGGVGLSVIMYGENGVNDDLRGGSLADVLYGNSGDDSLDGGGGDDHLYGGTGNNLVVGGAGNDIAFFGGSFGQYQIAHLEDGVLVSGPDGKTHLSGVEVLRFADQDYDPLLIVCPPGDGPSSGQTEAPLVLPELFDGGKEPGPEVLPPLLDEEPQILPPGLDGKPLAGDEPTVCRPGDQPDVGLDLDPPGPRIDRRLLDLDHPDLALIPGTRAEFGWTGPVSDYDWII